ncbi:hypothetical protein [Burkholderia gladioli]|uniref:hypothetical protein n=1 Tax=Burkholderia gladioli TaxID=28095 RepID=UPI00164093DC|nr:hypothetical protein [Burkholderia gladioli]
MGIDIQAMHEAEFEAERQAKIEARFKGEILLRLENGEAAVERIDDKIGDLASEATTIREKLDALDHYVASSSQAIQHIPPRLSNLAVPLWIIVLLLAIYVFR